MTESHDPIIIRLSYFQKTQKITCSESFDPKVWAAEKIRLTSRLLMTSLF